MSCATIIQRKDVAYIASDSAASVLIDGKYKRSSDRFEKLFEYKSKLYFISGEYYGCRLAKQAIMLDIPLNEIISTYFKSSEYKYTILETYYKPKIGVITISYDHSNNYEPFEIYVPNGTYIGSVGVNTQKAQQLVIDDFNSNKSIENIFIDTYKNLSNDTIGDYITVYKVNQEIKKLISYQIDKLTDNSPYGNHQFLLVADVIVGKLLAGNNLFIETENGSFTVDNNGTTIKDADFTVTNTDDLTKIVISPDEGFKIQTRPNTSSDWTNKFFVDTSGNLQMIGNLTTKSIILKNELNQSLGIISHNEYGEPKFQLNHTNGFPILSFIEDPLDGRPLFTLSNADTGKTIFTLSQDAIANGGTATLNIAGENNQGKIFVGNKGGFLESIGPSQIALCQGQTDNIYKTAFGVFYQSDKQPRQAFVPIDKTEDENIIYLGLDNYPWAQGYFVQAPITTSDRNAKTNISELKTEFAETFIKKVPVYKYQYKQGSSGRYHWGTISQEIENICYELGLSSTDAACWTKGKEYGIRETEFIWPLYVAVQDILKRLEESGK